MSDAMNMQPPGQGVAGKVEQMQSIFNPTDIAAMIQRGEITPQTPFGEVLAKMGISPNDTVMEVIQKTMRESRKANPLEKMRALSQPPGAPPQGMPSRGEGMPSAPVQPSAPGSMGELFQR